jgi:uncharacterized membrane protein
MHNVARSFEGVGVLIISVGGLIALAASLRRFENTQSFYKDVRRGFGRPLILGLEVLVAADIIQTITVEPTLESATVLGILVLVRVVLSFSLDIEVDGVLPWRRANVEAQLEGDVAPD